MDRESGRPYIDAEAEVMKARDKTFCELGRIAAVEVVRAEVTIVGADEQQVVGGGEHGGRHREHRFLGAAPTFDAQEWGAAIGIALAGGGPRRLNEGGL